MWAHVLWCGCCRSRGFGFVLYRDDALNKRIMTMQVCQVIVSLFCSLLGLF
jgi:hypothetical protein